MNVSNKKLCIIFIFLIGSIVFSCSNGHNLALENKINDIVATPDIRLDEVITKLIELDQNNPNEPLLKLTLGQYYLFAREFEKGGVYLKKANALYNKKKQSLTDKDVYALYNFLAAYSYNTEDYEECIKFINLALEIDSENTELIRTTLARAYNQLDRQDEALEIFRETWNQVKNELSEEAILEYLLLEVNKENWDKVIELTNDIELIFGQIESLGSLETLAYNALNKEAEKILSYIKDVEFKRFAGLLTDSDVMRLLSVMPKKELSDIGLDLIDVLFDFYQGNFNSAADGLLDINLSSNYPFYTYFELYVALMAGKGNSAIFNTYFSEEMDRRFSNIGSYYYYLWKGLKKGDGEYSFSVAQLPLEQTINLSPDTVFAQESRMELGRLLGLTEEESSLILIQSELEEIYQRIADGEIALDALLYPVITELAIEENIYTNLAGDFLYNVVQDFPRVLQHLKTTTTYSPQVKNKLKRLGLI